MDAANPGTGGAPAPLEPANVVYVSALSHLEQVLFQEEAPFQLRGEPIKALRTSLMQESFSWHFERCAAYRRYCELLDFTPSQLRSHADIANVPCFPTSIFKKRDVLSIDPCQVAKVCLSSGTQGAQSRVHRNKQSLERLLGTVRQGVALLGGSPGAERQVFVLGPNTEEAEDLWFAYVLSLVDFVYPTSFFVSRGMFQADRLLEELATFGGGAQPLLVGPPFLLAEFARMARRYKPELRLARLDGLVVTTGGWKRHQGEALSRREFASVMVDGLGVRPTDIRDTFNMVELNSVLFECEHGVKHVPPWLFACARDATTLRPVAPGVPGLLSYCDPTATSYPCFIVTDDVGEVSDEQQCRCGRWGQALEIARRVARVEARGCALKLDRALSAQSRGQEATP